MAQLLILMALTKNFWSQKKLSMFELIFAICFTFLVVIYFKRNKIVNFISSNFNIRIKSEILMYILTFFLIILMIGGVLLDNTKEKFSKISQDYDNLKANEDKRPHRYFDINTYD